MNENPFGTNLRFYRKKLGLTQTELGGKINLGQVSIANYERGIRFPNQNVIGELARALEISRDLLFSEMKPAEGKQLSSSGNAGELLKYLLNDSFDDSLNYVLGWMKSAAYSLRECYRNIITPLLQETGIQWEGGNISVLEEHLISERIREIITLTAAYDRQNATRDPKHNKFVWMGLCAPSDKHDLGLFMLSQLMRNRGWRSYFLGPDVPVNDLTALQRKYKPDLINISIISDLFKGGLEAYLQNLDADKGIRCPIAITGRGFSEVMEKKFNNVRYFQNIFDGAYEYALNLEKREEK